MGRLTAMGMADAVVNGGLSLKAAVTWHLRSNHFPPVPHAMVAPCITAINLAADGDWDALVVLPEGIEYRGAEVAPVAVLVETFHLDAFVVDEEG